MISRELKEMRDELREIRRLLETPREYPDDLVGPAYVARRLELSERTVRQGKAGTNAIPRVPLTDGGARPLIRFQRAAVDRFIAERVRKAQTPKERALRLLTKTVGRKKIV
jgi:hypothetical protein